MKIERVEIRELSIRLNFPFQTSFGIEQNMSKLLLTIYSEGLEGYGESVAGEWPGYSYETVGTNWLILKNDIIPLIIGKDFATPAQLLEALKAIRGHNMAVATVENAFWDLQAKAAGLPLWVLLGGQRTKHPVGISIGIQDSIEETIALAEKYLAEGYKRLKFKIKPGWDVLPMQALRSAFPDAALTVDANSAYKLTDARVFRALDELGLDYIEQPLAYDDLLDHRKLQTILKTPICLDESIHSAEDARKGLELESGRVINIKQGRVRGLLLARETHDVAHSFAAPVWCGGMLELGIGRATNLHLSSLKGFSLPGDTSSASRYWQEDIIEEQLDAVEGMQAIPTGAGLGITLKRDYIESLTVKKEMFKV